MDFIEIRRYNNYVAANIAKGLLEGNSIECFLQDEAVSTILPHLSIATGGIKLSIPSDQKERAEKLLVAAEEQLTDEYFEMGYFSN